MTFELKKIKPWQIVLIVIGIILVVQGKGLFMGAGVGMPSPSAGYCIKQGGESVGACCKAVGTKSEGWYNCLTNELIVYDLCGEGPGGGEGAQTTYCFFKDGSFYTEGGLFCSCTKDIRYCQIEFINQECPILCTECPILCTIQYYTCGVGYKTNYFEKATCSGDGQWMLTQYLDFGTAEELKGSGPCRCRNNDPCVEGYECKDYKCQKQFNYKWIGLIIGIIIILYFVFEKDWKGKKRGLF